MSPTLHEAVFASHPSVMQVEGRDVNSLNAIDSNLQPVVIDPSKVLEQLAVLQAQHEAEQTRQAEIKTSAISKLTALGLSADEIKALTGVQA